MKSILKIEKREKNIPKSQFLLSFRVNQFEFLVMKLKLIFAAFCISFVRCNEWKGNCKLMDTINITDGHEGSNGNFIHQGVNYSPGSYGVSNYIFARTRKVPVDQHMRGCICLYKTCIRICCSSRSDCSNDFTMLLPMLDDAEYELDSNTLEFGILRGTVCSHTYRLEPLDYEYDQWFFNPVRFLVIFYNFFCLKHSL